MRFFSDDAETKVTRNQLPHWQQEGATYFVTWRLKDSIPRAMMDEWKREHDDWMKLNPHPWTDEKEEEFHRKFSTRMDRILDDGHGECVLRKSECQDIIAESLGMFDGDRFLMHAWVAMPNHVHTLFSMPEGGKLEKVLCGWKGNTAKAINVILGKRGALWQKDYFDRMIRDWDHLYRVTRYIRRNPTKAHLPEGDYKLYEADWVKKMLE